MEYMPMCTVNKISMAAHYPRWHHLYLIFFFLIRGVIFKPKSLAYCDLDDIEQQRDDKENAQDSQQRYAKVSSRNILWTSVLIS